MTEAGSSPENALRLGELELRAQIRTGNNAVFVADVVAPGGVSTRCVYKPERGERPLWDFPGRQLAPREVAAYLVDRAAGWDLVPPTVLRDGPFGPGSCQLWVPHRPDPESVFDVFEVSGVPSGWRVIAIGQIADEEDPSALREVALAHADDERLARVALFDAVINNGDRKAGHLLADGDRLWAIDHGVSFHTDPKLRTVLWGWAAEAIPDDLVGGLRRIEAALAAELGEELAAYLDEAEIAATRDRVRLLVRDRAFPSPTGDWPALPYPLF